MTPDRTTMLRHWHMLGMVPRYPVKTTARELLERLEAQGLYATKRTIERDLHDLSLVFPLKLDERSKPYGWSWRQDAAEFNVPGLTADEALALALAERFLDTLLPGSVVEHMRPRFDSARKLLNGLPKARGAGSWLDKIAVVPTSQELLPPTIAAGVQQVVADALLAMQKIEVVYQRPLGRKSAAWTISPLGLVQRGSVTYVVCKIDNNDLRILALHRIKSAKMLDDSAAQAPDGFTLDGYIRDGAFGFGNGGSLKIELLFRDGAGNHLEGTPLSTDQKLVSVSDEEMRLKATVADTPQLRWWLLGFGGRVEVLRPIGLRREMAAEATDLARVYRKGARSK